MKPWRWIVWLFLNKQLLFPKYKITMKRFIILIIYIFPLLLFAQSTSKGLHARQVKSVYMSLEDSEKEKNNQRTFTRYDSKGNVTEYVEFDKDSIPTKWQQFSYNKNNEVSLEKILSAKGNVKKMVAFEYNHLGQCVCETTTDETGKVKAKNTISYNGMGDKVEELTKDENGNMSETKIYEYDNKGLLTLRKTLNAKGEVVTTKKYVYEY